MTFIFITYLDGTLLGHSHFDFEQIKSDVTGLLDTGHLLVLASSKTNEVERFCNALGRKVPFIYENGAGVENFNLPFECAEAPYLRQNPKTIRTHALLKIWEQHIPICEISMSFCQGCEQEAQQACLPSGGFKQGSETVIFAALYFSGSTSQIQEQNV